MWQWEYMLWMNFTKIILSESQNQKSEWCTIPLMEAQKDARVIDGVRNHDSGYSGQYRVIDGGTWDPTNGLILDLGAGFAEHFHIVKIQSSVYLWFVHISIS